MQQTKGKWASYKYRTTDCGHLASPINAHFQLSKQSELPSPFREQPCSFSTRRAAPEPSDECVPASTRWKLYTAPARVSVLWLRSRWRKAKPDANRTNRLFVTSRFYLKDFLPCRLSFETFYSHFVILLQFFIGSWIFFKSRIIKLSLVSYKRMLTKLWAPSYSFSCYFFFWLLINFIFPQFLMNLLEYIRVGILVFVVEPISNS